MEKQYVLNSVHSVTATQDAGIYIVNCNITDLDGNSYDCEYASAPNDTYGLAPVIRQWLVDHEGEYTILPYVAPPPVPYNYHINTLWTRLTDDEAEEFDAASATASPLKMRKQFATATSMLSTGELFAWVKTLLTTLFGAERADELLAEDMLRSDDAAV